VSGEALPSVDEPEIEQAKAKEGTEMTRSKAALPATPKMQFYTVKQVADLLVVSQRTVRRWIKSGELVAHTFGGAVRVAETDLKAFIATRREI
jgi:excisionase family DNA binding protein